jgi:hypothetical protein
MIISKKKYLVRYFLLIVFSVCAVTSLPLVSDAAITVTTGTVNPDGTPWPAQPIAQFTSRYGNNAMGGTWELSHNWNNGLAQDLKQYVWSNGVNVPFTFNHNSVTGTTTLTLAGGTSTTWTFTPPFMTQDIWLLVRSDSANFTSRIDTLFLNGSPIGGSIVAQNNTIYMHIHRDQIPYSQLTNFNLTGNITLSWTGTPTPPQILAMFTMTQFYPPPNLSTGANTHIITILALFAISAGLFILRRNRWIKA